MPEKDEFPVQADGENIVCTSNHQLYREMTWRLYCSVGVQPVVLSFPANSILDHNPTRGLVFEDNGAVPLT